MPDGQDEVLFPEELSQVNDSIIQPLQAAFAV